MIQFLFQGGHGSHEPRARALATLIPGSEVNDVNAKAVARAGLDTLTFWGHGDSSRLCGKTVEEIRSVIKAWKALNAGLVTVEILTCNARHCTSGDPYATRLKNSFGILSGARGVKVKALPTTVTGKNNAWSILLAETIHNSWVYITAPGIDDKLLMQANSLIQFEDYEEGGQTKKRSFRGDIAQRADQMVRANPDRQWTMNYGYLQTLRAHLAAI